MLIALVTVAQVMAIAAVSLGSDTATPPGQIHIRDGFQVDLLYSVPLDQQGSWVCMTVDSQRRLICGDQRGALYRVTLSPTNDEVDVQRLDIDIGFAQGLLYAYDRLYVTVAGNAADGPGLYYLRDTDGDDHFDELKLLKSFRFVRSSARFRNVKQRIQNMLISSGHGPHAICLGPDGMLYVIGGNHTAVPDDVAASSPYRNWDEDLLLPRVPDSQGIATGIKAPGGWIARTDKDGLEWTLFCGGLRNPYDMAFNADGELLTFDADMEFDTGTPWYRPCRILHLVPGGEYGWRYGSGKWPDYFADSLGSVVDVGRASPTGVAFGAGTRFPEEYQRAMFVGDWAFGKILAVHLSPKGASYSGRFELFAEGKPLAVVALRTHPDGHLYFLTGGRSTQSGLYRIRYVGGQSTDPATLVSPNAKLRAIRRRLETQPPGNKASDIDLAWQHLNSSDRSLRFAARTALESQSLHRWKDRTLATSQVDSTIQTVLAITRSGTADLRSDVLRRLNQLPYGRMSERQIVDALRAYSLACTRIRRPDQAECDSLIPIVHSLIPSQSVRINRETCRLLVYLKSPEVVETAMSLFESATTQEDQFFYAFVLRLVDQGWTDQRRTQYFQWLRTARDNYEGGMSFRGFVLRIMHDAGRRLPEDQQPVVRTLLRAREVNDGRPPLSPRQFVHNWQLDDFQELGDRVQRGRSFVSGQQAFRICECTKCHRIGNQGGDTGPDLSGVGNRFSAAYILQAIIEPSAVVPEDYRTWDLVTEDGAVISGRILAEDEHTIQIRTHPYARETHTVSTEEIEFRRQSPLSEMPQGLANVLSEEEILDLVAYLRAGGDANDAAFNSSD